MGPEQHKLLFVRLDIDDRLNSRGSLIVAREMARHIAALDVSLRNKSVDADRDSCDAVTPGTKPPQVKDSRNVIEAHW